VSRHLDVAPGDGALRTAVMPSTWVIRKSSTKVPSRSTAWARTPTPPRATSSTPIAGTYRWAARR
jgi:hypothetical protein